MSLIYFFVFILCWTLYSLDCMLQLFSYTYNVSSILCTGLVFKNIHKLYINILTNDHIYEIENGVGVWGSHKHDCMVEKVKETSRKMLFPQELVASALF